MSFDMAHQAIRRDAGANERIWRKNPTCSNRRRAHPEIVEDLVGQKTPINAVACRRIPPRPRPDRSGRNGRFCAALKDMGVGVFITELDASVTS
ncbi:hypothetical protein [Rhizobium leguminosarum]|uniref:hypothetical protein n=1 Tax=Rhizobium leguminosarum TaxID=384 RepID=UPI001FD9B64C|nr:hypothetical protein [Rhizobium leguminosarum]